jgi:hypothetical protein
LDHDWGAVGIAGGDQAITVAFEVMVSQLGRTFIENTHQL